jgi:CBS domain-containing protein
MSVLKEMTSHLKLEELGRPESDEELGIRLAGSFTRRIAEIATTDMPLASEADPLLDLLQKARHIKAGVMPVCDSEKRILGVIDEGQLICAIGEALNIHLDGNIDEAQDIKEVQS